MNEVKLKNIVTRKITDGPHVSPEYSDEGVFFISGSEIINGKIVFRKTSKKISFDLHKEFYKRTPTKVGDILLVKNGSIGNCAFVDTDELFSIWVPLALIKIKKSFNSKFVFYNIIAEHTQLYLKENAADAAQPNISIHTINNIVIPNISLDQQVRIANYLDTETSKIDRKISILEQKYEKLEEYKQSVIFETVTKGLDANVPMKNSEIYWIGDIPAHWEVKRVKDVSQIKKGKAVETFLEKSDDMLPCIDTNFLRGRDSVVFCKDGIKIHPNKVLILWDGANAGELFFNNDIGYLGSTFGVFNIKLNNYFWFYYLKGIEKYSKSNLTGMGIPHVDGTVLKQTIALIPSLTEQKTIVDFLNLKTSKIDKKKEIIKKQIDLLKEYKQTIIYEAVTGKIEL